MADFLPYGRQTISDEDIEAVAQVLKSEFLTTGPAVGRFEEALCSATGVGNAVAVNSGTSALHAMYFAAGLQAGDEIITSPLTFAATANAALYLGATVKFVDVEADTGNLDPRLLDDAISEKTKLIVPIDFAGHPAEYDSINAVAARHGLTVVADAAHSLGASYKGRPVGTLATATEVSFHPVKPVTTAEGGAVLTNSPEIARLARLFQTHGITRDANELEHANEGPWWYEQHHLGFNYRLTDLQAALGTSQLTRLVKFISRRREIAKTYDTAFTGVDGIQLPGRRDHVEPGWHLYVIRVAEASLRRPLFEALRRKGIGVQVHYLPVHFHPYYAALGFKKGLAPVAEDYYSRAVSLPIFPSMNESDTTRVIETVTEAISALT